MTDQTSRNTVGVAVLAALGMAAAAPQAGAGLPSSGLPTLELGVDGITFDGRGALSLGVEAGIAQGESDSLSGSGIASASGSFGGAIEGFSGGEGVDATVTVFDGGGLATAGTSSSGTIETGGLGATSGTFETSASGLNAFSDAAVQAGAFGLGIVSDDLESDGFGVSLSIPSP